MAKAKKKKEPTRFPAEEEAKAKPAPEGKPGAQKGKNLVDDLYLGLAEQTYAASPYVNNSQIRPYNPDDLYQKRGDYGIYEEMLQDDQISICLKIKKDLVLASGWDIVVDGGDEGEEKDTEIKEYLETCLREKTEGSFDDMIEEIMSAYEFGFSLSEKVFQKHDDGYLGLKYLRTRHPGTWLIHTDDQGIITKYEQLVEKQNVEIDPKALIHYINQPRFQNPYGTSDLRAAYNAWFTKRQIIRYFAIFLEKSASPIPVAKYKTGAPQQAVTDIFNAIKSFQSKTALAIPSDIEVEFLEAKQAGEAYEKALNLFNMYIGRALFIPDLLGFQGGETGGGSYSLGQDQINVFFKHVHRRRESLERIVNQQIIRPLVMYNFGDVENFPKWRLKPIRDEDAVEFAKLWLEAVKGKVYKPTEEEINHFRSIAKFPEGAVEFHEPVAIDQETGKPMPPMGGKPGQEKEDEEKEKPGAAPEGKKAANTDKKEFKALGATPGDYAKKVDFKAIESSMDRFKSKVIDQATPVIKRVYADLAEQLKTKKIIESQRADKLEALKIRHANELRAIMKKNMREAFQDARETAARELFKGNYARKPLPDDKFMDVIEAETSQFVDDWEMNILKSARTKMLAAIRDGTPLSTVLDDLDTDAFEASEASIERYARTKFTEVMNRGRLQFFNESGVVAAYQYSAILDDRTSEVCAGLHGKVFRAGDEPIPPMHFNCRSLLVPITKYEEWEADTKVGSKPIDQFIEDNKGDGFARHSVSLQERIRKPGVGYELERPDPLTYIYTYSENGKPFCQVRVSYDDKGEVVGYQETELGDADQV